MFLSSPTHREETISFIKEDMGWIYDEFPWPSPKTIRGANATIRNLLNKVVKHSNISYCQTKLHVGPLSPGCVTCAEGTWHCLYFTNFCPAKCFFCPQSPSRLDAPPRAQSIAFPNISDYISFIDMFGYKGVGFSGGDPFIKIDLLTAYVNALKKAFGDQLYVWSYTSGLLVNEERLKKLQSAGVDELRIDLAASNFNLKPVRLAKKFIPTVIVEIPAVPENHGRLIRTLPKLERIGLSNLNMHEFVVTKYNYREFLKRGYTFMRRNRVVSVLESELCALKTLEHIQKNNLNIPASYCTRMYKHSVQTAGQKHRLARFCTEGYEHTTQPGFIRSICINGLPGKIEAIVKRIRKRALKKVLWHWDKLTNSLYVAPSILDNISPNEKGLRFFIYYSEPHASDYPLDDGYEVSISARRSIYIQKVPVQKVGPLSLAEIKYAKHRFVDAMSKKDIGRCRGMKKLSRIEIRHLEDSISRYERIVGGFPEMF